MLLSELPTELIQHILRYLPPPAFLALSQTCKTLRSVADTPLLWRYLCRTQYKYWDPRHELAASLSKPVEDVPWKEWYVSRRVLDRQVDRLIDELVNNPRGRIEKLETLVNIDIGCMPGSRNLWDIKDSLLRHLHCDDGAEDVLARRFWASAAMEKLHHGRAVSLWSRLNAEDGQEIPLERLLGAYDLFVEGLDDAECADVSILLDEIAQGFRVAHPGWETLSLRQRATALALFLRAQGFQGAEDVSFHDLPNNFIVRALRNPAHPALPIVCVTIYCGVARRVNIPAQPCGFPMHVYAVIEAPDLDVAEPSLSTTGPSTLLPLPHESAAAEASCSSHARQQRMYIDAFRPGVTVAVSDLTAQLSSMGAGLTMQQSFLGPATPSEITARTSRNIIHSVRMTKQRPSHAGINIDTDGWPDLDAAMYAALWTSVLIREDSSPAAVAGRGPREHGRLRHTLPFLCELLQNHHPWDVNLLEEYILPLVLGLPEYGQLLHITRALRLSDANAKVPVRRTSCSTGGQAVGTEHVRYRIGQVFVHRRFRYQGAIIGWDVKCDASEEWVAQMRVDNLERGREQSFYHVLAEDKSHRYVAEDNIVPTDEVPNSALLRLAGRYFRRYDEEQRRFVSNIRDEYPDD
ncbi:hypothetical protein, variant [Verruconis gallopava]|uniref:F-box domain-containing protein n=1 Tax=Verruconis gallopava TaxID=253628 RepID=A0A0D2AML4_9PEZI|nr:uncharacterized protein PV09_08084 [Verruconis gallopava]XP_016210243.1 hypothetical protein, variant [Verruconis gallopava]KIW00373.1 hypothetical protein PV09_08084 [Verruconis gallopava]KIW00374.1 hypothetical protein, variant [Verruconis gallopava]